MKKIKIILSCTILIALIFCTYRGSDPGHPYILNFTLKNPFVYPVAFSSIQTPFDEYCSKLHITFGNETIPYGGPSHHRSFLFGEFISLAPLQSRTVRFNLGRFYNMTRVGTYTVQYKTHIEFSKKDAHDIPSFLNDAIGEVNNLATLWGVFAYFFGFLMYKNVAPSNSMNITISENDIPIYNGRSFESYDLKDYS